MLKLNKENLRKEIYRNLKRKKTNNLKLEQTFTLRTKICTLKSDTEYSVRYPYNTFTNWLSNENRAYFSFPICIKYHLK